MTQWEQALIAFLIVAAIIVAVSTWIFDGRTPEKAQRLAQEQKAEWSEQERLQLYENCAMTELPWSDDSSLDAELGIYTIYYWDEQLQDAAKLEFPYEPETGFASCSDAVKVKLRSAQETYESLNTVQ